MEIEPLLVSEILRFVSVVMPTHGEGLPDPFDVYVTSHVSGFALRMKIPIITPRRTSSMAT